MKKLDMQEAKYAAELKDALREQAAGLDTDELTAARLALRPEKERSAVSRVQTAYGKKYNPLMMADSKRDIAKLLGEEPEARSIRDRLRERQPTQEQQIKKKRNEYER